MIIIKKVLGGMSQPGAHQQDHMINPNHVISVCNVFNHTGGAPIGCQITLTGLDFMNTHESMESLLKRMNADLWGSDEDLIEFSDAEPPARKVSAEDLVMSEISDFFDAEAASGLTHEHQCKRLQFALMARVKLCFDEVAK